MRTRSTLHEAFHALILKKKYEAITVDEICEKANISRSTFYDHYKSKDDLKRRGLEELRRQLLEQHRGHTSGGHPKGELLRFTLTMFEHARDHLDHYRALVGSRGGAIALETIRRTLSDLVHEELTQIANKETTDAIPRELVAEYIVGAYMAVLIWWLDGGTRLPPRQIDAMFRRLAFDGLATAVTRA